MVDNFQMVLFLDSGFEIALLTLTSSYYLLIRIMIQLSVIYSCIPHILLLIITGKQSPLADSDKKNCTNKQKTGDSEWELMLSSVDAPFEAIGVGSVIQKINFYNLISVLLWGVYL